MGQSAAIFDLDRTLISGASGPVFSRHLATAGVQRRAVPGTDAIAAAFRVLGETAITAPTARLAARAAAGWPVEAVRAAATAAAEELATHLQPYAPGVIDEHREAGRVLVMATTSPAPLVTPFAELLGFDAVVATEWESLDGTFTGAIEGPLVWGRGKLEAVEAWAIDHDIDLADSYGYSDSFYDVPLLDAVGHPTAVNADVRLAVVAHLRRWHLRHFDLPDGVLKIAGRELQQWLRPLQRPELLANVDIDLEGIERIPHDGPVIAVFNHRSYFDGSVVGTVLGRTGRSFRFLGKKEVFDAPVIGYLSKMAGGIRVDRGTGSDEPLEHAIRALQAGEAVALAPQGTIRAVPTSMSRCSAAAGARPAWRRPRGRRCTRSGCGAPRSCGRATAGSPGSTSRPASARRSGCASVTPSRCATAASMPTPSRSWQSLVDLLPPEAKVRHTPTADELAATYPAGYRGDPTKEASRRPGTDT